jgi:hypothetical protein
MKKIQLFILMAALFMLTANIGEAQCAMCRATAESASQHVDKGIGQGLNSGIVYLMVLPYLLLATVATVFFRKKIFAFFKPAVA